MNPYNLGFVATEVTMLIIGKYLLNQGIHPCFYGLVTGVSAALLMLVIFKLRPTKKSLLVAVPTVVFFTAANA